MKNKYYMIIKCVPERKIKLWMIEIIVFKQLTYKRKIKDNQLNDKNEEWRGRK